MNKNRRKEIEKIINSIKLSVESLENVLIQEEESFENMPESLKISDNGVASEEAQEVLNDAIMTLEEAIECLEEL